MIIDRFREYELLVEEDAEAGVGAEGLRLREGPLRAHELTATLRNNSSNVSVGRGCGDACSPLKTANNAVRDLTEQLKAMDASALGSVVARELVEQRDIEDILFSS